MLFIRRSSARAERSPLKRKKRVNSVLATWSAEAAVNVNKGYNDWVKVAQKDPSASLIGYLHRIIFAAGSTDIPPLLLLGLSLGLRSLGISKDRNTMLLPSTLSAVTPKTKP
jgi:hypothetical protein